METQQKSAFSTALVPGLIMGVTLIVVDLIFFILDVKYDSKIKWLSFIVMAGLLFWIMSTARDKNYGGYISFGKSFTVGFWAYPCKHASVRIIQIVNCLRIKKQK